MFAIGSIFFLIYHYHCYAEETVNINLWRSVTPKPVKEDFPEIKLGILRSKPNTGLVLSGGGVNAVTSSFGIFSALESLNLVSKIRYLTSVR